MAIALAVLAVCGLSLASASTLAVGTATLGTETIARPCAGIATATPADLYGTWWWETYCRECCPDHALGCGPRPVQVALKDGDTWRTGNAGRDRRRDRELRDYYAAGASLTVLRNGGRLGHCRSRGPTPPPPAWSRPAPATCAADVKVFVGNKPGGAGRHVLRRDRHHDVHHPGAVAGHHPDVPPRPARCSHLHRQLDARRVQRWHSPRGRAPATPTTCNASRPVRDSPVLVVSGKPGRADGQPLRDGGHTGAELASSRWCSTEEPGGVHRRLARSNWRPASSVPSQLRRPVPARAQLRAVVRVARRLSAEPPGRPRGRRGCAATRRLSLNPCRSTGSGGSGVSGSSQRGVVRLHTERHQGAPGRRGGAPRWSGGCGPAPTSASRAASACPTRPARKAPCRRAIDHTWEFRKGSRPGRACGGPPGCPWRPSRWPAAPATPVARIRTTASSSSAARPSGFAAGAQHVVAAADDAHQVRGHLQGPSAPAPRTIGRSSRPRTARFA